MKLASLSLCAGALFVVSAASAFASTAYVASTVNLRSGPGTTNEIVAKIPAGSRIDASNCKDGWCEVVWQDKNGFAIQTALDLSGRVPPRGPAAARGYTVDSEYVPVSPPVVYTPPGYAYGFYPYYRPYYYRPYGSWRGYYRRHW